MSSLEKRSFNKKQSNNLSSLCKGELLGWYFHLLLIYKEIMNSRQMLFLCSHLLLWRAFRTFYPTRVDLRVINIKVALAINFRFSEGSDWSIWSLSQNPSAALGICAVGTHGSRTHPLLSALFRKYLQLTFDPGVMLLKFFSAFFWL